MVTFLAGKLGNQISRNIRFARAPETVDLTGTPSFGECSGWSQTGYNIQWDFANDDIYFLELCLFSMVRASQPASSADVSHRVENG